MNWDYNGYFGGSRTVRLEPGVFDDNARDVFGRGHCHSLALALLEIEPAAELMGIWTDGSLEHVFVRLPNGAMIDADGLTYDEDDIQRPGGDIDYLDDAELEWAQESGHLRRARAEDAMPFARALLERETALAA